MNLETLVQLAWARRRLVVVFATTTAVLVFILGLFMVSYEAEASFALKPIGLRPELEGTSLSPVQGQAIRPRLGVVYSSELTLTLTHDRSFVSIISSRSMIERVVRQLELDQAYARSAGGWSSVVEAVKQPLRFLYYGRLPAVERNALDYAVERTRRQITVRLQPNSSIVTITVRDRDAVRSAAIGEALLDVLTDYSREFNRDEARKTQGFVEEQLVVTRAQVDEQQGELDALQEEYGLDFFRSFSEENGRVSARLVSLRTQLEDSPFRREDLERTIAQLTAELETRPEYSPLSLTLGANPNYTFLTNRLLQLTLQRESSLFDYPPTSPEIQSLDLQLAQVESLLSAEAARTVSTEINQPDPVFTTLFTSRLTAERELAGLEDVEDQVRSRIRDDTRRMEQLRAATEIAIDAEVRIASRRSQEERLESELNDLRLLIARDLSEVQVLDRPVVPRYPVLRGVPLSIFVVIGFVAGLMLGIGFVVVRGHAAADHATPA